MGSEMEDELDEFPAPPRREMLASDRELLQLAARALGAVRFEEVEGEGYANLHFEDGSTEFSWNPLQFSGDALELAVKLDLFNNHLDFTHKLAEEMWPPQAYDPLAATCRAIVRAAAEIGKRHS